MSDKNPAKSLDALSDMAVKLAATQLLRGNRTAAVAALMTVRTPNGRKLSVRDMAIFFVAADYENRGPDHRYLLQTVEEEVRRHKRQVEKLLRDVRHADEG